jgi:hypothetical protein
MKNKIIIVLTFLLAACASKSDLFEKLLKSEEGHLRGVFIGASVEEVKKIEDNNFLTDDEADYLYYDYKLEGRNSYTVSYDFYDGKLYEIELAVFLEKIEDANKLFEDFKKYFDQKYGASTVEDDYYLWNTTEVKNKHHIEFALKNHSQDYGYVSLLVTDLDY